MSKIWDTGCDNCRDESAPVEYVAPIGYLCEKCRTPETIELIEARMEQGWKSLEEAK